MKKIISLAIAAFVLNGCIATGPLAVGAAYANGEDYNCNETVIVDGTEECQKNNAVQKTFSGFSKAVKKVFN